MGEFLPLFLGIAIGLMGASWLPRRKLTGAALCVALGATATWINGELEEPALILFDAAQVMAACAIAVVTVRRVTA
jgi:hypothetical protein